MLSCAQPLTIIKTPEGQNILLLKHEEYRHVASTQDYTSLNPVPRSLPTTGWLLSKCLSEIPWLKKLFVHLFVSAIGELHSSSIRFQ